MQGQEFVSFDLKIILASSSKWWELLIYKRSYFRIIWIKLSHYCWSFSSCKCIAHIRRIYLVKWLKLSCSECGRWNWSIFSSKIPMSAYITENSSLLQFLLHVDTALSPQSSINTYIHQNWILYTSCSGMDTLLKKSRKKMFSGLIFSQAS